MILINSAYIASSYFYKNTQEVPSFGGGYIEGMVGQPRFINPILAQKNDIDSDLSSIVYSSLLKLNSEGKLVNDLAESYEIGEDNLTYTFHIKKGVKWHSKKDSGDEKKELTVDDIIYTIQTIQNPEFNSSLRANWTGIGTKKIDDYTIQFILRNSYAPFLNNLTFGILPKHLWSKIKTNNFTLAEYNFRPVGSGPYIFKQLAKDTEGKIISFELEVNNDYYGQKPFIKKLIFLFFQNEDDLIQAFNRKGINGINYLSPENMEKIIDLEDSNIQRLKIPRYFAIFFNQTKNKALSDEEVRLALSYAVDKNRLIQEILYGEGSSSNSPIPSQLLGYNPNIKIYDYAQEHAKNILDTAGWIDTDEDGIREKEDVKIEFTLVIPNQNELRETGKLIQQMWKEIGVAVEIKEVPTETNELSDSYIKPREYEAVLVAQILNYDPDPFAFWHSSQKKETGLNLSLYDNPEIDKILEEARQEINSEARAEKYMKFQELLIEDVPAIFLYSPNYLYVQSQSIQGTNFNTIVIPSDRFNEIENWYMKTKRVWK